MPAVLYTQRHQLPMTARVQRRFISQQPMSIPIQYPETSCTPATANAVSQQTMSKIGNKEGSKPCKQAYTVWHSMQPNPAGLQAGSTSAQLLSQATTARAATRRTDLISENTLSGHTLTCI
jgi:hypothetical protein